MLGPIERTGIVMFKPLFAAVAASALFGAVFANFSQASEPALPNASYAAVGGATSVPYGWVDFCGRRPEECSLGRLAPLDVRMTKATWSTLNRINKRVNAAIEPITNLAFAHQVLQRLTTRDVRKIYPGKSAYACVLNDAGKFTDDCILYRTGPNSWMTVYGSGTGFEDMARRVPDLSKVRTLIGYRPTRGLDQILADILAERTRAGTGPAA